MTLMRLVKWGKSDEKMRVETKMPNYNKKYNNQCIITFV